MDFESSLLELSRTSTDVPAFLREAVMLLYLMIRRILTERTMEPLAIRGGEPAVIPMARSSAVTATGCLSGKNKSVNEYLYI
jgi:hypothetical protein